MTLIRIIDWTCILLISIIFASLITYLLAKLHFYFRGKTDIIEKLCAAVADKSILQCIFYLEKYPEYVNSFSKSGYTPFLIACAKGNTQLVRIMLKKGADVTLKSKNHESAFYLAVIHCMAHPHSRNASCIRELYYAGANIDEPNDKGLTPLQITAFFGQTPLVIWLLRKHASTNVFPSPYAIAKSQGHLDTADILSKKYRLFAIQF
ncbi:ankyrin-1-like [Diabrotica virgifera virgifera]|uniref:Ankyrin-1-like n=1 Tax=Diabrotica virgifera virgifera TaxID=50390 RepID=A0A6P7FAX0_DIAVI|nr:ankyrin-1-like [Diabrotica virgifera virgifera]